jgi:hypothetical protein
MRTRTVLCTALVLALIMCALPGKSYCDCAALQQFLSANAVGVTCTDSANLLTSNAATTPANNNGPDGTPFTKFADGTPLPGLVILPTFPPGDFAFTPTTDRGVISNGPTNPAAPAVKGVQVDGFFAGDPAGEARFLLRFPANWNGKLVVAGASGTRSEFNGDFAWSDYVLSKGYAYASQNKGVLNFFLVTGSANQPSSDSFSCRLNPASTTWVHFYDNDVLAAAYLSVGFDRLKPFTQWTDYMLEAARLAQAAAKTNYNRFPRRTYAVGTSNGGYQVRRAIEAGPDLFDGGVDWEGTFVDPRTNILVTLPPAIENFPAYVASDYDPTSKAASNIMAAGYPPDIVKRDPTTHAVTDSLWLRYSNSFWEVTQCQWQKRFDPTWPTYNDGPNDVTGTGGYDYIARVAADSSIVAQIKAVTTTGKIKKPLITVAGTMDALLPIKTQAREYEASVNVSRKGNNEHREAQYRLYEVQNGNHIEANALLFPQLRVIQPYAQAAFDLLVNHVENQATLPPSQCIPVDANGVISSAPSQPGHCQSLFVQP